MRHHHRPAVRCRLVACIDLDSVVEVDTCRFCTPCRLSCRRNVARHSHSVCPNLGACPGCLPYHWVAFCPPRGLSPSALLARAPRVGFRCTGSGDSFSAGGARDCPGLHFGLWTDFGFACACASLPGCGCRSWILRLTICERLNASANVTAFSTVSMVAL